MRPVGEASREFRRDRGPASFRVRRAPGHGEPLLEMQFARAAIIIQPVSDIAVLLHFEQADSAADRVHRVGRNVEEVSSGPFMPGQHALDGSMERRGSHRLGIDRFAETRGDPRPGLCVEDQPALLLALPTDALCLCLCVVGMGLDRQPLAGEDVFDQQFGEFGRRFEPDFTNPLPAGATNGSGNSSRPQTFSTLRV